LSPRKGQSNGSNRGGRLKLSGQVTITWRAA